MLDKPLVSIGKCASHSIAGEDMHLFICCSAVCCVAVQGIRMLQAIAAMKLAAGILADGVAEALAEEESEVVQLLAALPAERLTLPILQQLASLGVSQARQDRDSAADFELPAAGLDDSALQAGATSSDLAELAPYLDSRELSYVLEHREELAAAARGEGEGWEGQGSGSRAHRGGMFDDGTEADGTGNDLLLQLDEELELLPDGTAAGPAPAAATGAGLAGHQGAAWAARANQGVPWLPGGAAGGKVSVLGQLKASRHGMLPPSSRPLGKNMGVKPQLQVSWQQCQLGCNTALCLPVFGLA